MEELKIKNYVDQIDSVVHTDLNTIDDEMPYRVVSKNFAKACRKYIAAISKQYGWSVITKSSPFCGFSCFVKNGDKFIYVSLSDFRFWNWKEVLYRTVKHESDYYGGGNCYCSIEELETHLLRMFENYRD